MKRKIILTVILAVLCTCLLAIGASAATDTVSYSGFCYDNLNWMLYDDGELVISGTAKITEGTKFGYLPWNHIRGLIKSVTVEFGVANIDKLAFYDCPNLEIITIPNSVTSIGASAFLKCTNLANINIPNGVTAIMYNTFGECASLKSIDIPDSVTTIESYAFSLCTNLASVDIPDSVTTIGSYAFCACTNLKGVNIPDSVISIDNYAFEECGSLTKAVIYSRNVEFGKDVFARTSSDFELHGYAGSTAEAYASENGHTFVAIPEISDSIIAAPEGITVIVPDGGWTEGTNTFTVASETVCVVLVSHDGGETYSKLNAIKKSDGSYSFTATDVTADTTITVAVKGDVNGDGEITNADVTGLKCAVLGKTSLDTLTSLIYDSNGDGKISNADCTVMKAAYLQKIKFGW